MKFVDWVVKHPIVNIILALLTYGIWLIVWIICIGFQYDNKQKAKLQKIKEEQLLKEKKKLKRYSNSKFRFYNNGILKYQYYDVKVKGIEHRDFDIKTIGVDKELSFEFEPENQFDENAIKVLYDNIFIGYVPKNNIQNMIKTYMTHERKHIEAFVSKVEEDLNNIEMAIGFYQELSKEELRNIEHIDTTLIKTTKKDEFDSRQDNLENTFEDEELTFEYMYDTDTYLVCDSYSNELGEINTKLSEKLQEYEDDGKILYGTILETYYNSADNIQCKIRIYII